MQSDITDIMDDIYTVKSELNNLKQHNMYTRYLQRKFIRKGERDFKFL